MLEANATGGQRGQLPPARIPRASRSAFRARSWRPALRSGQKLRREDPDRQDRRPTRLRQEDLPRAVATAKGRAHADARDRHRERRGVPAPRRREPAAFEGAAFYTPPHGWERSCAGTRGLAIVGGCQLAARRACPGGDAKARAQLIRSGPGAGRCRYLISRIRSASAGRADTRTELVRWKGTGISKIAGVRSRSDPSKKTDPAPRLTIDRGEPRTKWSPCLGADPKGFIRRAD